jgi:hypothetical protein
VSGWRSSSSWKSCRPIRQAVQKPECALWKLRSPRRHDAAVLTGVLQYRKFRLAVRYESNGTWPIHAGPLCHTGQLVPSVSNSPLGKSPKSFRSPCCRLCKVFEVNKSREVSEVIRTCVNIREFGNLFLSFIKVSIFSSSWRDIFCSRFTDQALTYTKSTSQAEQGSNHLHARICPLTIFLISQTSPSFRISWSFIT